MRHLKDIELIELAAGQVTAARRPATEAHLAECPECQGRLAAARGTWQALGRWQVMAGDDLAANIAEAAARQTQLPPLPAWRRAARPAWRVAAAILLAAGIGHAAGRWAWPRANDLPPAVAEADASAAAEALSLDVLALHSVANLAEAVLDPEPLSQETPP